MANPEKMKSSGPLYLALNLCKEKGVLLLDIVNKNDKVVAFQIHGIGLLARDEFLPNTGLILPGNKIDIEIKKVQKGGPVRFKLCALLWPATDASQFDGALWKQLETQTPVQTITLGQPTSTPPPGSRRLPVEDSTQLDADDLNDWVSTPWHGVGGKQGSTTEAEDMVMSTGPSPYAMPPFVTLKVPCKGGNASARSLTLYNPLPHRITFKVRGNRMDRFQAIIPHIGFVEAGLKLDVLFQPKEVTSIEGFTKNDKFTIYWEKGPADIWITAEDVWKKGGALEPKAPKAIPIELCVMDDKNPDGLK